MRAVARDDNELPNCLRWVVVPLGPHVTAPQMTRRRGLCQEVRERGRRCAPAGWACWAAHFKAFVAIETQGEMLQREMRFRNQHSSTADHQHVSSRIGYRAMATRGLGYVKSLLSGFRDAALSAASRVRRARSCHRDNRHAERVAGFPRLKRLDPRSAIARAGARTAPRSTGARRRVVAEEASPHQSHPRRDYTASPIPESQFPKDQ